MYKAAVAGCGRIGFGFDEDPKREYIATHAGAYSSFSGTDLVAVCDPDSKLSKKCAKRWNVPSVYGEIKELIKNEDIDILSVCTPPETHYDLIKEAVKSKTIKAIFCEKPLAHNIAHASGIEKICRDKNIILQVGHQRRFDPLHLSLKNNIDSKKFGNVQHVNF